MSPPAAIRRAVGSDVAVLHRMLAGLALEIGYGDAFCATRDRLRTDGFGPAPMFRAMLAEAGEPVGLCVYFREYSTLRARPGVFVHDLYVLPRARGAGLAARLLGAAMRDASDWRASYMRLTVHRDNAPARAFYAALGFEGDPNEEPLALRDAALDRLLALP